jgi:hypothetical protein
MGVRPQCELRRLADGDGVEGRYRPLESLQRELADRLDFHFVLDLRVETV